MTDKELLELAAKAAGIKALLDPNGVLRDCGGMHPSQNIFAGEPWNPLEDDGDALRLAVKLNLTIRVCGAINKDTLVESMKKATNIENHGSNKYAATRLAITRVAAEIGRSMP